MPPTRRKATTKMTDVPLPRPEPQPEPPPPLPNPHTDEPDVEIGVPDLPVEQHATAAIAVTASGVPVAVHEENAPIDGLVLQPGDDLVFPAEDHDAYVIVSQNVYRKFIPNRANRPSYVLVYAKGSKLTKAALERKRQGIDRRAAGALGHDLKSLRARGL